MTRTVETVKDLKPGDLFQFTDIKEDHDTLRVVHYGEVCPMRYMDKNWHVHRFWNQNAEVKTVTKEPLDLGAMQQEMHDD